MIGHVISGRYVVQAIVGTGGMATKLHAASIATESGCDMLIANGADFHVIHRLIEGEEIGTLFLARRS